MVRQRKGRFELADGGTLFLDEIGESSASFQAKLLRILQEGEMERVGGDETLRVNVRIIAATNRHLEEEVRLGHFREDLYYRLNVMPIALPPLRERQSDIMLLATQFAIQMCRELGLPLFPGFSERAAVTLQNYRWPGNIRELKNVVERSVYRHGSSERELDNIIINPFRQQHTATPVEVEKTPGPTLPVDLRAFQQEQEKSLLERSLEQAKYNQKQAAELLGLTYHQLRALLKKHQL